MIEESSRLADACPRDLKALKRTIRQQHSRADKNVARKEYRAAAAYNDNIEISKIVMQEMNKFQTPEWQFKLEEAQKLYAEGLDGLTSVTMEYLNEILSRAKEMPKKTKAEKEERSAAIASAKERIFSKKEIEGKHNGHIELFDSSVFEVLFEREDNNLAVRTRLEEQLHAAKKSKDHIQVPQLKAKIKELKSEKKVIDADIKRATDENSKYNRLAKPYVDAQKLIAQAGNYTHYEEIKAMYKEAKARSEEAARIAEEKEKELEAERKAIREKSRRRQR